MVLLLLINEGSTDNSQKIINNFVQKDFHIRYLVKDTLLEAIAKMIEEKFSQKTLCFIV